LGSPAFDALRSNIAHATTSRLTGDPMLVRLFDNTGGPLLIGEMRESRQRTFTRVTGVDSLHAPTPVSRRSDVKVCPLGDVLRIFSSPFAPMSLAVPVGDGVVQSEGDGRYRLHWHDARGQ
jgi:hypothetical protein